MSFFGFISEMKEPKDYPKTLYTLQFTDTSLYLTAAVVIYYYGGDKVESPALGSTSPLIAKIAYGIAIPTVRLPRSNARLSVLIREKIVIAGIIYCQVAGKYIYVRIFRGTDNMHKRTFKSIGTWVAIVTTLWILSWIIASAIPVFGNLLSLIVALFASWFTCKAPLPQRSPHWYSHSGSRPEWLFLAFPVLGPMVRVPEEDLLDYCQFYYYRYRGLSGKLYSSALCFPLANSTQCGVGLYVTGKAIHDSEKSQAFSCANNA